LSAQYFAKSVEECAEFTLKALVSPTFSAPGFYAVSEYGEPTGLTSEHADALAPVWAHTRAVLDGVQ
jgi:hypothetical protein